MLNVSLFIQNAALAAPVLAQGQAVVNLPAGQSASSLLHRLYADAVAAFPEVYAGLEFPEDPAVFRKCYPESIVLLEGARNTSLQRVEVARRMSAAAKHALVARVGDREIPLDEFMQGSADPLPLAQLDRSGDCHGAVPTVPYRAYFGRPRVYAGPGLASLGERLYERHIASERVRQALAWLARQGTIDLSGQKFVILGAGAELAPTQVLLNAGATVLYLDIAAVGHFLIDNVVSGGVLVYPTKGANLLTQPREIAATIAEFANGDPIHIGSFAYAGGEAREWRLTAAANAIVRSLPPELVASWSTYISPTAPAQATPHDAAHADNRYKQPGFGLLGLLKALGLKPNLVHINAAPWVQTIVSAQGAAYQAAQVIEKIHMAEILALYGTQGDGNTRRPVTVSANVAGITRSRSMRTPDFLLGFAGASFLGLSTYPVATTRALSGWLMVHDLLNPQAALRLDPSLPTLITDAMRTQELLGTQVHGGLFAFPFRLGPAIKVAAALGATYRWDLLAKALLAATRGKKKQRPRIV